MPSDHRNDPLLKYVVTEDARERRTRIQAHMINLLLTGDEINANPAQLLRNEDGFIHSVVQFTRAFRSLSAKGCRAHALAQTLCYFQRYRSASSTQRGRNGARFPSRGRLRRLASMLWNVSEEVTKFERQYLPSMSVLESFREERIAALVTGARQLTPAEIERYRQSAEKEVYEEYYDIKFLVMADEMQNYASILEL